jgi:phosphoribosylanthranilate isomerase
MNLPQGFVKICGVKEPEHIEWAAASGATAVGLNFAPVSTRRISEEQGRLLAEHARSLANRPILVGVFLDVPEAEINRIAEIVGLDYVQVHIRDQPIAWVDFDRPVLPVFHPASDANLDIIRRAIDSALGSRSDIPAIFLDAYTPNAIGGTGQLGNWDAARTLVADYPVILAGGLTPENVTQAIADVQPAGVDVASGVESDKTKDQSKIKDFVANARSAFAKQI